eukprot:1301821-Pleurochrysis_carterae.AAC.3
MQPTDLAPFISSLPAAQTTCVPLSQKACTIVEQLWNDGYSGIDVIGTFFRITKNEDMDEALKLEFIKEVGIVHMRVLDGVDSLMQLTGLVGKLCVKAKGAQPVKLGR